MDENNWLRSMSNELYLWYDEIEDQDPASFDDSLSYFEQLKTFALTSSGSAKDRFHFTAPTEKWLSEMEVGYGLQWGLLSAPDELPRRAVVAYLDNERNDDDNNLPDTVTRGAKIVSVDGVEFDYGDDVDTLNNALWPTTAGESHTFEILPLGATDPVEVTLVAKVVESDPVQHVKVETTNSGRKVGYMLFNDHLARAESQLISEVKLLVSENIDDLVLDLRYNSGGYLGLASELAYMIAGDASEGQAFEHIRFNDKYPEIHPFKGEPITPTPFYTTALGIGDESLKGNPLPTLNLPRLFVLTGENTCSASEAIMNGLRGIDVEVIQIGGITCGKPYGFYPLDNCGTTYFTIQFAGSNAKGFGDYTDGFFPGGHFGTGADLPGCEVGDDFDHLLGDVNEARFAAALNYIESGDCGEITTSAFSESGVNDHRLEPSVRVPKDLFRSSRIMVE
ncbi:S41 family peptidase [Microbulbifer epialgicus]|uniref:S41 family peptidase n=1 Tax=Microbulbifer epialgicus TaxID=393907 RepID=A0ABV4NY64_9GAMM